MIDGPAEPALSAVRRDPVFEELRADAGALARRHVVFLVDHGRSSRSTHKFWWNHFEDACRVLGIGCRRVGRASEAWPRDHREAGRRGVYLFFTGASLYHDRWRLIRAVRPAAVRPDDIVASWDPAVAEEFPQCPAFQIGFRSMRWMAAHAPLGRERTVVWEPFAPLSAVARGAQAPPGSGGWDFSYFGTLNPHNYDQFQQILRPLAARYRCRYGGKLWRIASPVPLLYGFSPFMVDEDRGLEILHRGRINLVLHNDYHRRAHSVTERLFVSAALGRPVVCDSEGAWQYFRPEEIPVGAHPDAFRALCEEGVRDLRHREEIARDVQEQVRRRYTYMHTVVQFLTELDAKASSLG